MKKKEKEENVIILILHTFRESDLNIEVNGCTYFFRCAQRTLTKKYLKYIQMSEITREIQ